jgi:hypothetical protein
MMNDSYYLQFLKPCWSAMATAVPYADPFYPTSYAISLLSAYLATNDISYLSAMKAQLQDAYDRTGADHLWKVGNDVYRDAHSRLLHDFAVAAYITKDQEVETWRDNCAKAMHKLMPRSPRYCFDQNEGESRLIFHDTYIYQLDGSYLPSGHSIDPNQNATAGSAFSLLYHSPGSFYYHHPDAQQIAQDELLGSISAMAHSWSDYAVNSYILPWHASCSLIHHGISTPCELLDIYPSPRR